MSGYRMTPERPFRTRRKMDAAKISATKGTPRVIVRETVADDGAIKLESRRGCLTVAIAGSVSVAIVFVVLYYLIHYIAR